MFTGIGFNLDLPQNTDSGILNFWRCGFSDFGKIVFYIRFLDYRDWEFDICCVVSDFLDFVFVFELFLSITQIS